MGQKHHKYRCRDLKRQLEELEEYNEILAIRLLRSQKRLRRMKIERNLLLERFERTRPYNDSGSDSDVPLKDTFPRPPASDVELIETIYTAGNARSRRKAQQSSSASVLGTPPQPNAANGGANDPTATIAATNLSTRKPRSEKDPNAPKRPANAFVLFCQAERPNIKNAGTELSSSELTRAMGAKWKAL
ncbi:non-histone protein, partial [Dipsacomyces acuminosporus]